MTVIDLQQAREEREPHVEGSAHCGACGHQWYAVVPPGVSWGLECSECGSMRGMLTNPIGSPGEDRLRMECACGCQLFFVCGDGHAVCHQCGVQYELDL